MKWNTKTSVCAILEIAMSLGGVGRAFGDCSELAGTRQGEYLESGLKIGTIAAEVEDFGTGIFALVTFVEFDVTFGIDAINDSGPFGCRVSSVPINGKPTSDGDFLRIHSVRTVGSVNPAISGGWITQSGRSGTWFFDIGTPPDEPDDPAPPDPDDPPSPPPDDGGDCADDLKSLLWVGTDGDAFLNADSWDLLEVPTAENRVLFSGLVGDRMNGGTVRFDQAVTNESLGVVADGVLFDLNGETYTLTGTCVPQSLSVGSDGALTDGSLDLLSSAGQGRVQTHGICVGDSLFDTGNLALIDNMALEASAFCDIGFEGTGRLDIANSLLAADGDFDVAAKTGSTGDVFVNRGAIGFSEPLPANLRVSGRTRIGVEGTGTMTILDGVVLSGQDAAPGDENVSTIADGASAIGTVRVDGASSSWLTQELVIGGAGDGDLIVKNGGAVDSNTVQVGLLPAGSGGVSLSGGGSWEISGRLVVGAEGVGIVRAEGGGVETGDLIIGRQAGSRGTVILDGTGLPVEDRPRITIGGATTIGEFGVGSLTIRSASGLTSPAPEGAELRFTTIGDFPESQGTVQVDGAGALWFTERLTIGEGGNADLSITNGGRVFTIAADVAAQAGRRGNVSVTGGSAWRVDNIIFLGGLEGTNATLSVDDTSSVRAQEIVAAPDAQFDASRITITGNPGAPQQKLRRAAQEAIEDLAPGVTVERLVVHQGAALNVAEIILGPGGEIAGDGALNVNLSNGGTISPAADICSTAVLNMGGDYTQASNGVLAIKLGGAGPGSSHDALRVQGAATLAGTLRVDAINGFRPAPGETFEILTADSISGAFDTIEGSGAYDVAYEPDRVVLTVLSSPTRIAGPCVDGVPSAELFPVDYACGVGVCGTGAMPMVPLMLCGLGMLRRGRKRR